MKRFTAAEARKDFSEVLNLATFKDERVRITRHHKEVAAIIPIEDLRMLELLEDHADLQDALRAEREAKERGEEPIPWEEVRDELMRPRRLRNSSSRRPRRPQRKSKSAKRSK